MIRNLEGLDGDIEVIRVNVQVDNVHMVVVIPPRIAIAAVVGFIKTRTAKRLQEKFDFIKRAIPQRSGIWSRGYCVSSVDMTEKRILNYVDHQEKDDKGQLEINFGG